MPCSPIPKPATGSPRPQRRHFADQKLRELQSKLLKSDLKPTTADSTYKSDFSTSLQPPISSRTERRSRRKYDAYVAPLTDLERLNQQVEKYNSAHVPTQKDADSLLYLSTYQVAYTTKKQSLNLNEFHYLDDRHPDQQKHDLQQSDRSKTPASNSTHGITSLYRDSYSNTPKANLEALGNPGKQHVMTKMLYKDMTPDLTVRDLMTGDGRSKKTTSYSFDFRDFSEFVPSPRKEIKPVVFESPVKAVKYRRWAQQ